jgi:hypothetical protein
VADCPGVTVAVAWESLPIEKSSPVPVRATPCGLPVALSVIVREPDLVPAAVGSKKTPIEQLAPTATPLLQLLNVPKSAVVLFTPLIVRGALPLFVSVTVTGRPDVPTYWPGKEMDDGDKLTTGTSGVLPTRPIICGLPEILSEMLIAALKVPKEGGVKVAII